MSFEIMTLAQQPELFDQVQTINREAWPMFMKQAGVSDPYWSTLLEMFPDYQIVICDHDGRALAIGHMIPAVWDGTAAGLPGGWDNVLMQGLHGIDNPNTLSMLGAIVAPEHRGRGLGLAILRAMKSFAGEQGLETVIAPVRPPQKSHYPLTPIERYMRWTQTHRRQLPFDPWVRVHVLLGAKILRSAPCSMVITGSVAQWEEWADMRFPESGLYVVRDALHAIVIDCEQDVGRYEEPHIWVRYRL